MIPHYPFRRGDRIRVSVRSWVTTLNVLFVRVRYNDGSPDRRQIPITHSAGDYTNELFFSDDIFLQDGYIESLTVDSGIEDKEAYIAVFVDNEGEDLHYCIFAGLLSVLHTPLGYFEHEDWRTWGYQCKIANGGGGGGEISWEVVPGVGNEMRILYGGLINGDTTTRTAEVRIDDDGGNELGKLVRVSTAAAGFQGFPTSYSPVAAGTVIGGGVSLTIAGEMVLHADVDAVAAGEDATFSVVALVRGGLPTVTEVGNSTPTITINTEKFF